MCWTMALALGNTLMSYGAKSAAADRQERAYQQNAVNANAAAGEKYAQEQLRLMQEREKAVNEKAALRRKAIEAKGQAVASSGNQTMDSLVSNDLQRQASRQIATTNSNLKATEQQSAENMKAYKAEAETRINSVQRGEKPSLISEIITGIGPTLVGGEYLGKKKTTDKGVDLG